MVASFGELSILRRDWFVEGSHEKRVHIDWDVESNYVLALDPWFRGSLQAAMTRSALLNADAFLSQKWFGHTSIQAPGHRAAI